MRAKQIYPQKCEFCRRLFVLKYVGRKQVLEAFLPTAAETAEYDSNMARMRKEALVKRQKRKNYSRNFEHRRKAWQNK